MKKIISKVLIVTILFSIMSCLNVVKSERVYASTSVFDNLFDEYKGTSKQDFVKKKYLTAMNNLDEKVRFSFKEMEQYNITAEDINYYYDAVLFEHPEIFYVARVNFSKRSEENGYYVYIGYIYNKEEIYKMKAQLEEKINSIIKNLSSYSELRKMFEIYDYIRVNNNYYYDMDSVNFNFNNCNSVEEKLHRIKEYKDYFEAHSIYGTLINEKSVWEGYSKTLMVLLRIIGYKTGIVRSGDYGWNYVFINGYYYHIRFNYKESYYEYYSNPYKYFNFSNKYIELEDNWTSNYDEKIYIDSTYDNIFRENHNGKISAKNVVRIENKLYYLDDEYRIHSYSIDGQNKKLVYSFSNGTTIKYMKAYKNYLYFISYELVNGKYICLIKRYNVETGKIEQVLNINNKFNADINYSYINRINFYIFNGVIYIDYIGKTKSFNLTDVLESNIVYITYSEALEYVKEFEKKLTYKSYKKALNSVNELESSYDKDKLLKRIKKAKKEMDEKDSDDETQDDWNDSLISDSIILPNNLILYTTPGPAVDTINRENSTLNDDVINKSNTLLPGEWLYNNGNWYHVNSDLHFTTGWLRYNGSDYYFDDNKIMVTGWKQIGNNMYYFDDNGTMRTGWLKDESTGKWYYLQDDGTMVRGTVKCGYRFADDGTWIK